MNFFYEKYILFAQGAGPHLVVYNKHIFMFAFKFFILFWVYQNQSDITRIRMIYNYFMGFRM